MAWREYCAEVNWLKEHWESMDRYTRLGDITETPLKMALNTIVTIGLKTLWKMARAISVMKDFIRTENLNLYHITYPNWKHFADDNWDMPQIMWFFINRVEKIVGKVENAGHQHFLFFPKCFQMSSLLGLLHVSIVCLKVKQILLWMGFMQGEYSGGSSCIFRA